MKKILFISQTDGYTGSPLSLFSLIKILDRDNFDVLTLMPGELFSKIKKPYHFSYKKPTIFKRILYKVFGIDAFEKEKKHFIQILEDNKYSMLYANTVASLQYALELRRQFAKNVPLVVHIHEMPFAIDNYMQSPADLKNDFISHYIVVNHQIKNYLQHTFKIDTSKITVCYPVNENIKLLTENFAIEHKSKFYEYFIIGMSGTSSFIKGLDLIPQLLRNLINLQLNVKIHFIGEIDVRTKKQLYLDLEKLGLLNYFVHIDTVTNPIEEFKKVDIFLCLSREESFSFVLVENALLKKPVLFFENCVGSAELISNTKDFHVPYLDLNAMSEKIRDLYSNEEKLEALGEYINIEVKKNYDPVNELNKNLTIINETAN